MSDIDELWSDGLENEGREGYDDAMIFWIEIDTAANTPPTRFYNIYEMDSEQYHVNFIVCFLI